MINSFGFPMGNQLSFLQNNQNLLGSQNLGFWQGNINGGQNLGGMENAFALLGQNGFPNLGGFNGFQNQQGIFGGLNFQGGNIQPPSTENIFSKLDTDGDGNLSQAEWQAPQQERWTGMDTNGDGQVTQEEFAQAGPPPGPPPGGPWGISGGFGPGGMRGMGFGGPSSEVRAAHEQFRTDLESAGIDRKTVENQAIQDAISQVSDSTLKTKLTTDLTNLQALGTDTTTGRPDPQRRLLELQLQVDLQSAGLDLHTIRKDAINTAISQVTDATLKAKLESDVNTLDTLHQQEGPRFSQNIGGFGQGFGFNIGNQLMNGLSGFLPFQLGFGGFNLNGQAA